MKTWTIVEIVLGVLAIGMLGVVIFATSSTSRIILGILIAAVGVVGVGGPLLLKNRNKDWHC